MPELPALPDRPEEGHKGTFGTVVVIGGSTTMIGAPALAAGAALRSGVGLCRIATEAAVLPFCLTIEPSATGLLRPTDEAGIGPFVNQLDQRTVLAVGPGMGVGAFPRHLIEALLRTDRPIVLDADGLNNLAAMGKAGRRAAPLVLTPHPGEYQRLAESADISLSPTDPQQRPDAARALAEHHGAVVVLKGQHTIIADPERSQRNETGSVALATAGSGDVLTGLIASLIAQGSDAYDAAVLGAHLHGLAADLWSRRYGRAGLTASHLAAMLPETLHHFSHSV